MSNPITDYMDGKTDEYVESFPTRSENYWLVLVHNDAGRITKSFCYHTEAGAQEDIDDFMSAQE